MDHITSDYSKDMDANWAMAALEKEIMKSEDRASARKDLLAFLVANPPFMRFYELCKAVDKY